MIKNNSYFKRKYEKNFKLDDSVLDLYNDSSVFEDARNNDKNAFKFLLKVGEDVVLQEISHFFGPNHKCWLKRIYDGHFDDYLGLVPIALIKCLKSFDENIGKDFDTQLKGFTYYFRRYLQRETYYYNRDFNTNDYSIQDMQDKKIWDPEESRAIINNSDTMAEVNLLEPSWKKFLDICNEDSHKSLKSTMKVTPIEVFLDYYVGDKTDKEIMEERGVSIVTIRKWKQDMLDFIWRKRNDETFPLSPEELELIADMKPKWAKW